MSSRYISHRKPKRPNINPIHEEPDGSEERFSDDSKNRALNSPLQRLVEDTHYGLLTRARSNPIPRAHSLDYSTPSQNPLAVVRRNTFTDDQSYLPAQGEKATVQAAKPSTLDWQNRRSDLGYSENEQGRPLHDRAGQLQSYTPHIGGSLLSNLNETQRRFIEPGYTMNGIPRNDAPILFADPYTPFSEGRSQLHDTENANFSTADATKILRAAALAGVDYETVFANSIYGLEGLRIDARRDHYPVQSNIPNYYQEPSASSSITSRTNSTASSDSRRSQDAFGLVRLGSNPSADYSHNRQSMDSADRSSNSFRSERARQAYGEDVIVWQDNIETHARMQFDTQCRGSNWVSRDVLTKIKATCLRLSRDVEFQVANGEDMKATSEVRLFFRKNGGDPKSATFFVAPDSFPYDILLGSEDCLELDIIKPAVMPIIAKAQDKTEKKATAIGIAKFIKREDKHEQQRKEKEKEKAKRRENNNQSYNSSPRW